MSAKTGTWLSVGFAKTGTKKPRTTYHTVSNRRTDGKLEVRDDGFVWKKPLEPGEYSLFVHTRESDLKHVSGVVVIAKAQDFLEFRF